MARRDGEGGRNRFELTSRCSFLDCLPRVTALRYVPSDGTSAHIATEYSVESSHAQRQTKFCGLESRRWVSQNIDSPCRRVSAPLFVSPSVPAHECTGFREDSILSPEWRVFDVGGHRSSVSSSPCMSRLYKGIVEVNKGVCDLARSENLPLCRWWPFFAVIVDVDDRSGSGWQPRGYLSLTTWTPLSSSRL